MASGEGQGLPPQAFLPVGREVFAARQIDGDAALASMGQERIHHSLHKAKSLQLGSGGQPLHGQIQIRVALKGGGIEHRTKQPHAPQQRPTLPQSLRRPCRRNQQLPAALFQKALLLGPDAPQVLVVGIDGNHGGTLREPARFTRQARRCVGPGLEPAPLLLPPERALELWLGGQQEWRSGWRTPASWMAASWQKGWPWIWRRSGRCGGSLLQGVAQSG
jgi:hypothetical protein